VRISIQPQQHHDHDEFLLPHQRMWFLLMLVALLMLLSKTVAANQWVIA
jgi:hypothetical protein